MNVLMKGISMLASTTASFLRSSAVAQPISGATAALMPTFLTPQGGRISFLSRCISVMYRMHLRGPRFKKRPKRQPLDGKPFAKGVVIKTLIKKPKKPNSGNRKCVLVRLSTGKEMVAYVPGIGHNLQEHNIVLVRCGRLQDCPGVKLKCVRGKHDLPHVVKQTQ